MSTKVQQALFGKGQSQEVGQEKEVDLGNELTQKEVVHDRDVVERADLNREEAMHMGELTAEEEEIAKKLRKRIDSLIMPLVMSVYLMNYIDRNNYAAARLQGLQQSLDLNGQEYQTGLSILFVGYVLVSTICEQVHVLREVAHPF